MAVSFACICLGAASFSSISGHPILHGRQLFNHLWNTYPAWLWAYVCGHFNHLRDILPSMAVSFSSLSGILVLHGCQLFNHPWGILSKLFNHPRKNLSCMAVSFSSISGTSNPAWLSAFQPSLKQPFCMAVSFSIISRTSYLAWL